MKADRLAGLLVKQLEGDRPIDGPTRAAVLAADRGRCVACGSRADLTIDHIWPRARGGITTRRNLLALCRACNSSKGDRSPWEWRGRPGVGHRRLRLAARSMLRLAGLL
ncbi:MAG TPA: HNH endonuclease [Acidimicrobiales bacterium]|nr:HNH endonuclease [Acidimicrobiales bacterium]